MNLFGHKLKFAIFLSYLVIIIISHLTQVDKINYLEKVLHTPPFHTVLLVIIISPALTGKAAQLHLIVVIIPNKHANRFVLHKPLMHLLNNKGPKTETWGMLDKALKGNKKRKEELTWPRMLGMCLQDQSVQSVVSVITLHIWRQRDTDHIKSRKDQIRVIMCRKLRSGCFGYHKTVLRRS
jgi:hypothetical protein